METITETVDSLATVENIEELQENLDPSVWEEFLKGIPKAAMNLGIRIVLIAVVFFLGTRIIKLIMKLINKSLEKVGAEKGVITFIDSFLNIVMYAFLIMILASGFGVDAASILAIFGSATLAIGLALQGSLSNLAGGVVILLMKPFKVGDYIGAGDAEGTVSEITIIHTCLHTIDNKVVYIPNAKVTGGTIVNYTLEDKRRLEQHYSISYNADFEKACEAIRSVLRDDKRFLSLPDAPMIVMDGHKDSSVGIMLRVWVKQSDYWSVYYDLFKRVKYAFDAAGIEIPYAQLDVHLDRHRNLYNEILAQRT